MESPAGMGLRSVRWHTSSPLALEALNAAWALASLAFDSLLRRLSAALLNVLAVCLSICTVAFKVKSCVRMAWSVVVGRMVSDGLSRMRVSMEVRIVGVMGDWVGMQLFRIEWLRW